MDENNLRKISYTTEQLSKNIWKGVIMQQSIRNNIIFIVPLTTILG
jgi:hypothetical protein